MRGLIKILIAFLIITFSYTALSQNSHMLFKNVEIDGTLTDFISKMEKQGFQLFEKYDLGAAMEGTFAGKKVSILIPCKSGELVWNVTVDFAEENVWSDLKHSYKHYKDLLSAKYGEGESYEFFRQPYYEGDGYELSALKNEKCVYSTYYETDMGNICLEIHKSCCIRICYEEKQKSSIRNLKRKQQEYNDL